MWSHARNPPEIIGESWAELPFPTNQGTRSRTRSKNRGGFAQDPLSIPVISLLAINVGLP